MILNSVKTDNVELKLIDIKDYCIKDEVKFDFLISNPPYISLKEKGNLAKELK